MCFWDIELSPISIEHCLSMPAIETYLHLTWQSNMLFFIFYTVSTYVPWSGYHILCYLAGVDIL